MSSRSSPHYWDVWPDKLMRERFVHDWDDWKDFSDNSLISRNRRSQLERKSKEMSEVIEDKNQFKVKLDVSHFTPEEINVKFVDNCVIISGKHEEVEDKHGWVSRQFTRRYALPQEYDSNQLYSILSSDGILVIEAPVKRVHFTDGNERLVPISLTNERTNGLKYI